MTSSPDLFPPGSPSAPPPTTVFIYPKIFYFFYYAALASFLPYLILYYEQLGFTGGQIGVLASVLPFTMLVGSPFWSEIADATGKHRRLLLIAISAALAAVFMLAQSTVFVALLCFVGIYAFMIAPVMPLVDNSVLEALGERRNEYGRQRLWGAVGWGLSAPLVGWITDRAEIQWAFYIYLILMLGVLFAASRLPIGSAGLARPFGGGLQLLRSWPWRLFLLAAFTNGVSLAVIGNFLVLHMNDLGSDRTLIGLAFSIATVSEIPVMFFASRLLKRWGAHRLLVLALTMSVVRLAAYSFVGNPWFVLPIQLLHGLTFGVMWIAGVSYAKELAPREVGTTAQSLFTSVTAGLGGGVGALVGGRLYDWVGSVHTFRIAAVLVLVGLLVFLLAGRRSSRERPSAKKVVTVGEQP